MVTVKNSYDEWEFRALGNGQVECRNEKLKQDWAVRSASEINYLDDHLAFIWDALHNLSALLPKEGFALPKADAFTVPQSADYSGVL